MGLYREHVLPHLIDRACSTAELREWRSEVAHGLHGTVVEIGFGSGLNVAAYPPEVELVYAVEPAAVARRLAERRIAASPVRVVHIGLDGASIPLDDESCDSAPRRSRCARYREMLSTAHWRRCTVCCGPEVAGRRPRARSLARHVRRQMAAPGRTAPEAARRRLPPRPPTGGAPRGSRLRGFGAARLALCQGAAAVVVVHGSGGDQAERGGGGLRRWSPAT